MSEFSAEEKAMFETQFSSCKINVMQLAKSLYVHGFARGTNEGYTIAQLFVYDRSAFVKRTGATYEAIDGADGVLRLGAITIEV